MGINWCETSAYDILVNPFYWRSVRRWLGLAGSYTYTGWADMGPGRDCGGWTGHHPLMVRDRVELQNRKYVSNGNANRKNPSRIIVSQ
jgi:hypothetical protein